MTKDPSDTSELLFSSFVSHLCFQYQQCTESLQGLYKPVAPTSTLISWSPSIVDFHSWVGESGTFGFDMNEGERNDEHNRK